MDSSRPLLIIFCLQGMTRRKKKINAYYAFFVTNITKSRFKISLVKSLHYKMYFLGNQLFAVFKKYFSD